MQTATLHRQWSHIGRGLPRAVCKVAISVFYLGCFSLISNAAPALTNSPASVLQELNLWLAKPQIERSNSEPFAVESLTKADAATALSFLWRDYAEIIRTTPSRVEEIQAKEIDLEGLKMKFDWLEFGDTNQIPPDGHSLFISLHGGGGTTKKVNDQQWTNQIQLGLKYHPDEGVYVAPRAPTDTWNMWHQAHIDRFLARLIEDFIVFEHVNPNRVYLMGYSAGGDGVYQLAPRMADRWAAAAMMAGHPNDASPLGLRNVPFAIQVGANDAAYHRNKVAAEWGRKLDALQHADPLGYHHFTKLYPGEGHWMDLKDRRAIPWMEQFTREPLPQKVVWHQDDVTHARFYWLERPENEVMAGQELIAERAGQVITLSSTNVKTVTVLLNDAMLDLDKPVVIQANGQMVFSNTVTRTVGELEKTLSDYGDTNLAFSSAVTVVLPQVDESHWWSQDVARVLQHAGTNGIELTKALEAVPAGQRSGMEFLVENMPQPDRETLSANYLVTNTALAYEGLANAAWVKEIPTNIFLNDILPYAVVNENRDAWREQLRHVVWPLVRDCKTSSAAALAINRKLFGLVKVRYSTERAKADQSPLESMGSGLASCTGLSILLVDACRSVGVPARLAGTPMWMNGRGNHSWVEIWDDGWHFVGAAEPDPAGLDHAWFLQDAAQAQKDQPEHAIYASSFAKTDMSFPLVWAPEVHWVNAVNVTDRYAQRASQISGDARLLVKVVDSTGRRVDASVTAFDPANPDKKIQGESKGESADLNNIFSFNWPVGERCEIDVKHGGKSVIESVVPGKQGEQTVLIRLAE